MVTVTNTITGTTIVRPTEFEQALARKCVMLHNGYRDRIYRDRHGNRYRVSIV